MIEKESMTISKPICVYHPKIFKRGKIYEVEHIGTLLSIRTSYFVLDIINKFYKIFDKGED